MIRIYLDWNVVSNLKRPENKELKDFLVKYKDCLLFPYSPAHFNDLMKSYSPENKYFQTDLETLEYLSGKHLIRWGKGGTELLFGTPDEYFQGEKDKENVFSLMDMEKVFSELNEMSEDVGMGGIGELLKSLYKIVPAGIEVNNENREMLKKIFPDLTSNSSIWDLMKDIAPFSKNLLQNREYYKDFRKSIGEKGFKVEANAGNWSEDEVIDKIDNFLKEFGTNMTFIEFVESTFKHRNEPINRYEFFTTAYLILDFLGYKADKLPKPSDNMQNIQIDGEHAFYGAHCDYFVVGDKNLRTKSKILYKKFNISTEVLSPDQLKEVVEKVIFKFPAEMDNFIGKAFDFVNSNMIVESYPLSEDNDIETCRIKLPLFYFNFFNYAFYSHSPKQNIIVMSFEKVSMNYSSFIYFTEAEILIDRIISQFGFDDKEELNRRKNEFVYGDKATQFIWNFESGQIILEKDSETRMPILSYWLTIKKEENRD